MKGLIGYSGFVGSNINQQYDFDQTYNSKNIAKTKNKNFDLMICAGAPGSMLHANIDKRSDRQSIENLIKNLKYINADNFVLISSIAVYENMSLDHDEDSQLFELKKEYGKNRKYLEDACYQMFENLIILRLPSLFGYSLKKNFIYDILNPTPSYLTNKKLQEFESLLTKKDFIDLKDFYRKNRRLNMFELDRDEFNKFNKKKYLEKKIIELKLSSLSFHSSESSFQFYNLLNLKGDLEIIMKHDLNLVNLVSEPICTSDLYRFLTNKEMDPVQRIPHNENIKTKFSNYWSKKSGYIYDKDIVKKDIKFFLKNYKNTR